MFPLAVLFISAQVSVTTYHNNLGRTGENLEETILTPDSVNSDRFGQIFAHSVDGQVYAQPLYLPSVSIPGKGIHNVVFVATEHDSVYAFDADSDTGASALPIWQVSFLNLAAGETTVGTDDVFHCPSIAPELGITGTPVIDPTTNTLYVVAMTKRNGLLFHRLHALDVTTGAERPGSPVIIEATFPGMGDGFSTTTVQLYPWLYKNRTGLLVLNGVVYIAWASHCDSRAYHGWITGYDAKDLHRVAVFNDSPNAYQGSFWMGGAAPAADADGNIYVVSANGRFDVNEGGTALGNSVIKLSSKNGLTVADYFTPFNQLHLDRSDLDLGSSGAVLLPDTAGSTAHPHLLLNAGKEGRMYLIDRDQMGHFRSDADSQIIQSVEGAIGALYGCPAYFHNTVYFSAVNDSLKAFPIADGRIGTSPASKSKQFFGYPGAVPTVTANGSSGGIVWLIESAFGGTLHAYDASNVAIELYNSQMNSSRDSLGSFVKFSVPTVANGKVYVGTQNALAVYGMLNEP